MIGSLEGEIHVFQLNLGEDAEEIHPQTLALLSPDERERAERYRHPRAKHAFVRGRSALRTVLGHYLDRPAADIRFEVGSKGKPRLADCPPNQGLVFNVSHSGDWALIALAENTTLGVDIERIRSLTHREGMAQRCFSPEELTCWKSLPVDSQDTAFFALWSCKESFVKATGEGIGLGLDACVVDLMDTPRLTAIPPGYGKAEEWHLTPIPAGRDYSATACHHGAPRTLRIVDGAALPEL